jgi:hypothetical protein
MPTQDRDEIIKVVHEAVEAAINRKIVAALAWLVVVGIANFGALVTGIIVIQSTASSLSTVASDRWTGTMEDVAEWHRKDRNPNYKTVNVRDIQTQNRN